MPSDPLTFSFPGATTADGNRFAGSLADTLRDLDPDTEVNRVRDREDTQDFGVTLIAILGTTAVTALAKGIASWLARNSGAKIEIRRDNQVIMTATHLDSQDVPKLVQALSAAGIAHA